jgi:hypothetical protein
MPAIITPSVVPFGLISGCVEQVVASVKDALLYAQAVRSVLVVSWFVHAYKQRHVFRESSGPEKRTDAERL